MSTSRTVTINNLRGECERVSLPIPFWGEHDAQPHGREDSTGVWLLALYYGPKTHRAFIQSYSIWQRGNSGQCEGTQYRELTISELLHYCERVGCQPPDGIDPAIVD
jgi:hypothetical protein